MSAVSTSGVRRAASGNIDFGDDDVPLPMPPRVSQTMAAVRPAPPPVEQEPTGRMIDSAFLEDEVPLALELSAPPGGHIPLHSISGDAPMPATWATSGSGLHMIEPRTADPRPGIVAFAGYGLAPEKLSAMPAYAFRVLVRKHSLRGDLKIAHWRRLPKRDIELYEAALACADEGAVTKGVAVVAASFAGTASVIAAAIAILF